MLGKHIQSRSFIKPQYTEAYWTYWAGFEMRDRDLHLACTFQALVVKNTHYLTSINLDFKKMLEHPF